MTDIHTTPGEAPAPDDKPGGTERKAKVIRLPGAREPEVTLDKKPLTGRVITADDWEATEDPEGDRPLRDPRLRTKEGRQARRRWRVRQAQRRARRWARRQRTADGVLPRAVRGERRVRAWVVGVEGAKARADMALARQMVRDADREARRARVAIRDRKKKAELARAAQQDASRAVVVAQTARDRARRAVATRASVAYAPPVVLEFAAYAYHGGLGLAAATLLTGAGAAWLGRRRDDLTEDELERQEQLEAGLPERFDIGMTPRMFEQMMRQALTEDLKVNLSALRVSPEEWGFKVEVWLERMTPEKISAQLDLLEACLPGVRTASILLQQSASARNECVIRVPGPNPWKAVPELPYRAPHSIKTSEIHTAQIGADMSGRPLALPVQRTNVDLVGASRSGKSTVLRAELDVLTATEDQIVIGIDLGSAGSGFGPLRRCMHAVATTAEQADTVLRWALDIGKGRPALFDKLSMGENWVTSAKRPGIKIVVDEFPALVRESRRGYVDPESGKTIPWNLDVMLAELAVTSAKSDVTLIIAGQGITKEKVKDNTWLGELQVQMLAACDTDDVVQAFGGGAMAQGWRPDRLMPAMGDQINDAGVVYVMAGAAYCEPIPYRACITSQEELRRRAIEREKAGLVKLDAESAALSSITLDMIMQECSEDTAPAGEDGPPQLIATIRQIFADAADPSGKEPAGMTKEQLADALAQVDPDRWALELFDSEDDEDDWDDSQRVAARVDALRDAISAVLKPLGQTWTTDSFRPPGAKSTVKGYCLRDLKKITGESS